MFINFQCCRLQIRWWKWLWKCNLQTHSWWWITELEFRSRKWKTKTISQFYQFSITFRQIKFKIPSPIFQRIWLNMIWASFNGAYNMANVILLQSKPNRNQNEFSVGPSLSWNLVNQLEFCKKSLSQNFIRPNWKKLEVEPIVCR